MTSDIRDLTSEMVSATAHRARRLCSGACKREGCAQDQDPPAGSELSFPLMCKSASTTPTQEAELCSGSAV